ncbi:MAG: sugar phosphate isomerase/epimerase [Armatimonadetes bacterium]|nr:sugar phosphate isomerase/epimerase [Armatimonadota bacterium]
MKLAFSTLGCPDWEIDQILDTARSEGYDGVELRHYQGSLDLPQVLSAFPEGPAGFRRRFERAGVQVCCLDTSIRLSDPDPSVSEGERMIELAMALGAPYLRVFGGDVQKGETRDDCLERAAAKLQHLGNRAAQRGKRVLLETHDAFSSGKEVAELLTALNGEGIGALWDLNHPYRQQESPEQTATFIGRQTYHVHVKDSDDSGGLTLLGQGTLPLEALVQSLHGTGYNDYLTLEWEKAWHPELAEPEVALPHAAHYLSELLRKLGIPRG